MDCFCIVKWFRLGVKICWNSSF